MEDILLNFVISWFAFSEGIPSATAETKIDSAVVTRMEHYAKYTLHLPPINTAGVTTIGEFTERVHIAFERHDKLVTDVKQLVMGWTGRTPRRSEPLFDSVSSEQAFLYSVRLRDTMKSRYGDKLKNLRQRFVSLRSCDDWAKYIAECID